MHISRSIAVAYAVFGISLLVILAQGADPLKLGAQALIFAGCLGLVFGLEEISPWRGRTACTNRRWRTNLAMLMAKESVSGFILPAGLAALAIELQAANFGLFNNLALAAWQEIVLAVLILDFAAYWAHRTLHIVPFLWRVHQVHHSDEELDASSVFRGHPLEALTRLCFSLFAVTLIGLPPEGIIIAAILRILASAFHHGNFAMPDWLEHKLRMVVVTPIHHRIHHSEETDDFDTNYGQIFSFWDKVFVSWRETAMRGNDNVRFGLGSLRPRDPDEFWSLLILPFRGRRPDGFRR